MMKDLKLNGENMVNATELVKQFPGKRVTDYLKSKNTKTLIKTLQSKTDKDVLIVKKGGAIQGTLMSFELAVDFTKWLQNDYVSKCKRNELIFFDTLENTIKSTVPEFNIIRQYDVIGFKIDGVYIREEKNWDYLDIDKETITLITCFEYDEEYHRFTKNKDEFRKKHIVDVLIRKFDVVEFITINESDSYKFLAAAIPYYQGYETDKCGDILDSFTEEFWKREDIHDLYKH